MPDDIVSVKSIETLTAEILIIKQQTAQNIIEIGKRLILVKEALPHGEWGKWLEEKVEFSHRTANNFMKVAAECSNSQALANLPQTKIFALLDLPPEEREEFISEPQELPTGEVKTVDEMTTRELQAAVKARRDAEDKAKTAEAKAQAAESKALAAEEQLEEERQAREEAEAKVAELENAEPEIVEKEIKVVPDDYLQTKEQLEMVKTELEQKNEEILNLSNIQAQAEREEKLTGILAALVSEVGKYSAQAELELQNIQSEAVCQKIMDCAEFLRKTGDSLKQAVKNIVIIDIPESGANRINTGRGSNHADLPLSGYNPDLSIYDTLMRSGDEE